MLNSEMQLENYICSNLDQFIKTLEDIYGEDTNIKFVGRQVNIGTDNIADLVFYYEYAIPELNDVKEKNYIVVELKNRELVAKDLSQLSRYTQVLSDKLNKINDEEEIYVDGVFVGTGISNEMQDILTTETVPFEFIIFEPKLDFKYVSSSYSFNEDYIENLKLDERLLNIKSD